MTNRSRDGHGGGLEALEQRVLLSAVSLLTGIAGDADAALATGQVAVLSADVLESATVAAGRSDALAAAADLGEKPRLLVLTDIGGDPDDQQSMARLMAYSSEYEIEGLIATSRLGHGQDVMPQLISDLVSAYGLDRPNLVLHDPDYPTKQSLLDVIKSGQGNQSSVGAGFDTEGSTWIITVLAQADDRPVWISIWGGSRELRQALFRLDQDVAAGLRTAADVQAMRAKIRVHAIADQDGHGDDIRSAWPDVFWIDNGAGLSQTNQVFRGQYQTGDTSTQNATWINANIKSHGNLGTVYPPNGAAVTGMKEGDTPSYLYVLTQGLSDPQQPSWGSWGGRFQLGSGRYVGAQDLLGSTANQRHTVSRWRSDFQSDFAQRMRWTEQTTFAEGNHHPLVVLNGDTSFNVMQMSVSPGSVVNLSALGSSDPDGDDLSYVWWNYAEADSYAGAVAIANNTNASASLTVPVDALGKTIHLILEVTDDGSTRNSNYDLARYRRLILNVDQAGADTTAPTLAQVSSFGTATRVLVRFSEAVEEASAEVAGNYALNGGITVGGANRVAPDTVELTTSALSTGVNYTLTVNNVKDLANNVIAPNSQGSFTFTDVPAGNLVLHLPFVEGMGASTADQSANGNNGALVNGPAWVAGKVDSALQFDGVNDYVQVTDHASLDAINGAASFAAWVKRDANQSSWRMIVHRQAGTASNDRWGLGFRDNSAFLMINAGGTSTRIDAPAASPNGQWLHLAGTWDGSTMRLYLNGAQVASGAKTGAIAGDSTPVTIGGGRNSTTVQELFDGSIDQVLVYSRALSAAEIAALVSDGNAPPPPPPADTMGIQVGGQNRSFAVSDFSSYGSGQDLSGGASIVAGGTGVQFAGNSWKKLPLAYNVTANTILEFDFQSSDEGEIHGIGLDNDNADNNAHRIFQVHGSQTWTGSPSGSFQNFNNYTGTGTKHYSIRVGDFYTGAMSYLVFSNDGDSNTGVGVFSNIELYEDVPSNQPPVAGDDTASTSENTAVAINVLTNDSDPNGDPLAITGVNKPTSGSAVINGSQITYTPNPGFTGADSFSYTINDGKGGSDTASVSVTVNPASPAVVVKVNFQTSNSQGFAGYLADTGLAFGNRGNGFSYGWNIDNTAYARNRNAHPDERFDTLNHLQKSGGATTWEIALPNGTYNLHIVAGDPSFTNHVNTLDVEGVIVTDPDGEDNFDAYDLTVTVTDGRLTIRAAPGSGATNAKLNFIDIASDTPPPPSEPGPFIESAGLVVMEAEHFTASAAGSGSAASSQWSPTTSFSDSSGGAALEAAPNTGVNALDTATGPRLDYAINFTTTGAYYAWVRLWGTSTNDDSVHVGLDGQATSFGQYGLSRGSPWGWINSNGVKRVTVNVTTPGVHTFNVWMREDGTRIDKLLLTTSASLTPSAQGPAESQRESAAEAVRIMALGDSITQADAQHDSYRRALWLALQNADYNVNFVGSTSSHFGGPAPSGDFDYDHEGHWGKRADEILAQMQADNWAGSAQPDIVLIHLGSNDIFQGQSDSGTVNEIGQIIDVLRMARPDVTVLLAQIIPHNHVGNPVDTFNNLLPNFVAGKTTTMSPVILVDQQTGFHVATDTYDNVHPNLLGEQKIADNWFETLAGIL